MIHKCVLGRVMDVHPSLIVWQASKNEYLIHQKIQDLLQIASWRLAHLQRFSWQVLPSGTNILLTSGHLRGADSGPSLPYWFFVSGRSAFFFWGGIPFQRSPNESSSTHLIGFFILDTNIWGFGKRSSMSFPFISIFFGGPILYGSQWGCHAVFLFFVRTMKPSILYNPLSWKGMVHDWKLWSDGFLPVSVLFYFFFVFSFVFFFCHRFQVNQPWNFQGCISYMHFCFKKSESKPWWHSSVFLVAPRSKIKIAILIGSSKHVPKWSPYQSISETYATFIYQWFLVWNLVYL